MPDQQISELTPNPSINGTEEMPTERGGANYKNTFTGLKVWLQTVLTLITKHSELSLDDGTNPHGTTKSDVGLGNVDNTTDLLKPISTATQTGLNGKQDNSTVTDFTDAFTIADGTNNKTLTMTNAVDKNVTVKATTFSSVGDKCIVSNLSGAGFPILVAFDANIEFVDTDGVAAASFGRKGLERVNDVGPIIKVQLY